MANDLGIGLGFADTLASAKTDILHEVNMVTSLLSEGNPSETGATVEPVVIDEAAEIEALKAVILKTFKYSTPDQRQFMLQQADDLPRDQRLRVHSQMTRQLEMFEQRPNEALLFATKNKNLGLCKILIEDYGANTIEAVDEKGQNSLFWAAWFKSLELTKLFVRYPHDIHHRNKKQQTVLHWACMGGSIPIMKELIAAGADLEAMDEDGYRPVHCCAQYGFMAPLDYIHSRGADIFAVDHKNRSPLHWAAYKDNILTTQWLVTRGLPMDAVDSVGRLPLHWAAAKNNGKTVKYLIHEIQNEGEWRLLEMKDHTDFTPLELALDRDAKRVASHLRKVETNEKSAFWNTYERLMCTNNEGKRKDSTDANRAAVVITVWFFVMTNLTLMHYFYYIMPLETSRPTILDNYRTHQLMVLLFFAAQGLWIYVHTADPGYIDGRASGKKNKSKDKKEKKRKQKQKQKQKQKAEKREFKMKRHRTTDHHSIPLNDDDAMEDIELGGMTSSTSGNDFNVTHDEDSGHRSLEYQKFLEAGLLSQVCVTCEIVREPRSKHCQHCNRCVTRFDHHCPWIDNCVGEGNHASFTFFLFVFSLGTGLNVYLEALAMWYNPHRVYTDIVLGTFFALHSTALCMYVIALLLQNLMMMFGNLTVNEKINMHKYGYLWRDEDVGKFVNPFDEGVFRNAMIFCKLIDPRPFKHDAFQDANKIEEREATGINGKAGCKAHSHGGHGGHGHSHGGKPCGGHGGGHAKAVGGQHGHSHGGKPCGGHGGH